MAPRTRETLISTFFFGAVLEAAAQCSWTYAAAFLGTLAPGKRTAGYFFAASTARRRSPAYHLKRMRV